MNIKLQDYYFRAEEHTARSNSKNISSIVDRLIRLTAKITECFAGDIYYDINTLLDCVEKEKSYDCILLFSESGVWTVDTNDFEHFWNIGSHNAIQMWQLKHEPETTETILKRVEVR